MMEKALEDAYDKGMIGKNIIGSDFSVDFYVHRRCRCLYLRRGNIDARIS
jgi:NADH:ubiquinone oxidoreductase subunit F (NADH-binding)